jgi:hypothetical protein
MGGKEELTVTLFFEKISPVFTRCYAFHARFCQVCFIDAKGGKREIEAGRLKMAGGEIPEFVRR